MKKQRSSGMPQIHSAFGGWTSNISLTKHRETVVDGIVVKNYFNVNFRGTIQPLSPRAISLKPEGQRSWTWLQIHCIAINTDLIPGDRISWKGSNYKIMEMLDYSLNGYIEYHIIRDYQDSGTK